jgi:hypothetical protein
MTLLLVLPKVLLLLPCCLSPCHLIPILRFTLLVQKLPLSLLLPTLPLSLLLLFPLQLALSLLALILVFSMHRLCAQAMSRPDMMTSKQSPTKPRCSKWQPLQVQAKSLISWVRHTCI